MEKGSEQSLKNITEKLDSIQKEYQAKARGAGGGALQAFLNDPETKPIVLEVIATKY